MPIAGFKPGDRVRTISGKTGTVASVHRIGGREKVTVRLDDGYAGFRDYYASSLRLEMPPGVLRHLQRRKED